VLPSRSEGAPNVLLEAMLARVPVVATAVGGVPEIVENERSALLVKAEDPVALAEAISRLLDSSSLATTLTQNAYTDVMEHHSPDTHYAALLRVYQELAKGMLRPDCVCSRFRG
jgi:glycosyltransferase involved in cell wall biosynthesis